MNITNINSTFKEFTTFVVKEITLHPLAAIALIIFPLLGIFAACAWGIRKAYYSNDTVKEQKVNDAALPIIQNCEEEKPKALETLTSKPTYAFINKENLLKGAIIGACVVAAYSLSQYCLNSVSVNQAINTFTTTPNPTVVLQKITESVSSVANVILNNTTICLPELPVCPANFTPVANEISSTIQSGIELLPALPQCPAVFTTTNLNSTVMSCVEKSIELASNLLSAPNIAPPQLLNISTAAHTALDFCPAPKDLASEIITDKAQGIISTLPSIGYSLASNSCDIAKVAVNTYITACETTFHYTDIFFKTLSYRPVKWTLAGLVIYNRNHPLLNKRIAPPQFFHDIGLTKLTFSGIFNGMCSGYNLLDKKIQDTKKYFQN